MKIDIFRTKETPRSVSGELFVDNQLECLTLEPSRTNPVHEGHPCIPAGVYSVVFTPSPHLGYITPELLDVPDRSDIRIHIGNFPQDSLGCVLVGQAAAADTVLESRQAFNKLMTLLKTALGNITVTINDVR